MMSLSPPFVSPYRFFVFVRIHSLELAFSVIAITIIFIAFKAKAQNHKKQRRYHDNDTFNIPRSSKTANSNHSTQNQPLFEPRKSIKPIKAMKPLQPILES